MNNVTFKSSEEPIVLSKYLLDTLLKDERPSEVIALYAFYYYTAKWQKTDKPKSTTLFTAKALHWTEVKVRKVKQRLKLLGLIENIVNKDERTNKIVGHYIKLNFIWYKTTPPQNVEGGINPTVVLDTPNALIPNSKNALVTNNINAWNFFIKYFPKNYHDNKQFIKVIKNFITHRKEKRKPVNERIVKKIANKCVGYPLPIVIKALQNSIDNDWLGVFPESVRKNYTKNYDDNMNQEKEKLPDYIINAIKFKRKKL